MKQDLAETLLGFGFSRLSARRRKQLKVMLLVSLAAHAVGLGVFGSWVVMRGQSEEKTVFVQPPPIKTYEPRKLEHRVKVQKRQRSSSRPSMTPRLVAMKTSTLALPKIHVDPKIIQTSFQPKFKAVSGQGLGVGLGTGYGLGGFGGGVSAFNFFGIRGRGDRIAILVDVSVSMVEEERGGPAGFLRVKNRISDVLKALNEAAMFTLVCFADAATTWQEEMKIASDQHKEDARRFLRPFNTEGNWGLKSGNVYASNLGLEAIGGTTRLDLALTAAFLQGADTILVISDGLPRVERGVSREEMDAYEKRLAAWEKKNAAKIKDWEMSEVVEQKVWVEGHGGKLKEGVDPGQAEGRWVVRKTRRGRRPTPPAAPAPDYWTFNDFVKHLGMLQEACYAKKGKKPPIIHCIGYQIDRDGGQFLKNLAREYKGHYRRVARLR